MIRRVGLALICLLPALPAAAVDMPLRKAGLWEIRMVMAGGPLPTITMQQCTDETTDQQMSTMFGGTSNGACTKQDMQKTASGMVVDSVCSISGMTMTTHAEISGDFNSAYTVKVTSTRQGGPANIPANTQMTMEAKWLGACAADQKAGDMIMPGGMKMNIKTMQAMRPPTAPNGAAPNNTAPK
jgi:hypothetical protein